MNGGCAGRHLVEDDAERVHVRAAVDRRALRLLGREVRGGAHDRAGAGEAVVRAAGAGDAEVGDLHLARGGDEHVARLHVAVHHAVLVRERRARRRCRRRCRRPGPGAIVPSCWIMSRSVWPSMYSMTMNDVPCSWPQSKIPTMLGWFRPAADWASRRNRSTNVGSRESSGERTLSATGRSSLRVAGEVHVGHAAARDLADDLVAVREDGRRSGHGSEQRYPSARCGSWARRDTPCGSESTSRAGT